MQETGAYGFAKVKAEQEELGARVRALFAERGFISVAAEGFGAPGVVVCYTDDPGIKSGAKFAAAGLQTAAGVPLMRSEEHTSELQSLMRISYDVFCLKK